MNALRVLMRKKVLDPVAISDTQLARVLNVFDLTALGVGSTLGVGVYVLAGHVARDTAGPAVVLSFLIAAVASVFAGLCYAEFGSRVPRAGSAYIYSYVTVGEFIAFVVGWNLILEYVIGSASVARGLSLYLDTLINNTLQNTFKEIAPINVSFMSEYFDFFSCGLAIILAIALAFGMKESSRVNNLFTALNIFVVVFVIIAGSINAKAENWDLPAPSNSTFGHGGFFPYGFSGVIKGAATCFYGFVGFDCIATTGEEVRNPQHSIPYSIISSLAIVFLAYFGTATVVTLMIPYYNQDINAPIPHAFAEVGMDWAKWVVAIGGIFGLCSSLFGAMFPLPRVIYAMASDGIIFKFLGNISPKFHTPLVGTLLAGLLTGLMSALFDLKQLVNMMSIGTLLAYTLVAACVLLLRYADDEDRLYTESSSTESNRQIFPESPLDSVDATDLDEKVTFRRLIYQTFNLQKLQQPTKISQKLVVIDVCIFAILCLILGLSVVYLKDEIEHAHAWVIVLLSVIGLLMILILMSITTQPHSKKELKFKVPLIPLIPALSILVNIYLMLMLDVNTWIRFGVWMAIGLPIYFISVCCIDARMNKTSYSKTHAVANGALNQINQSNGHVNSHIKIDEEVTDRGYEKKEDTLVLENKNVPEPDPLELTETHHSSSPDNLSVCGALAALDDMLSREEQVASSYSLASCYDNSLDRKMSTDTTSTISNMHFEESVEALIHYEDNHEHYFPPPTIEEQIEDGDVQSIDDQYELKATIPPPPPPPPPMEGFKSFVPHIPRVNLRRASRDSNSVEIRSRKASFVEHSDNVAIGSNKYKDLASRLNKVLVRQSLGLPSPNKLLKPSRKSEDTSLMPVLILPTVKNILPDHSRDSDLDDNASEAGSVVVEEEVMKPADIRKKLNEILRSDPRLTMRPLKSDVPVSSIIEESQRNGDVGDGASETEDKNVMREETIAQLEHKNLMSNTLKSIKLRKVDSFKSEC